jgi:hypothetical protein
MKVIALLCTSLCLVFAGTFGIGVIGGTQYDPTYDYQSISPEQIQDMYYGGEIALKAEAFPNVFLEPSLHYLNNPTRSQSTAGVGLGVNIKPRLGRFPIVPHFGVTGTILFYNDLSLTEATRNGTLDEYLMTSTPTFVGAGFAGLSLYLGDALSLDCNYRYHSFAPYRGITMVWGGLSYYVNW